MTQALRGRLAGACAGLLLGGLLLASWAALASAQTPAAVTLTSRTRELMHTRVTITLADAVAPTDAEAAFAEAFAVFERVDESMNEWRAGSPLWRINEAAGTGPVEAPADLCDALAAALKGARLTGGLFDPTWAALRNLWRFSEGEPFQLPDAEQLAARCRLVSWKAVELRPTEQGRCMVRLPRRGMALGLGGLAKGWGVDQAVAALRRRGLRNFFVQAGGDLYAAGRRGTRPWQVGIRDPRGGPRSIFALASIEDAAFSTSGDYEHFALHQGVRYHHIIDLRTCRPATRSRSVTLYAKSAVDAELLTKSVFVAGPQAGLRLAAKLGAGAVVVDGRGRVHTSRSLKGRVRFVRPRP